MNRARLVAAWIVAAAVSVAVAWGVLSAAAGQVAEGPETPVLVVDAPTTLRATSVQETTTVVTETVPESTVITTPRPSTTKPPASTTKPPASTTVTTDAPWDQKTISTPGGVVVVRHRPGEVRLDSATPAPGFSMDIEETGPDEVKVEFENDDHDYDVRVRWEDGALTTETD